MGEIVERRGEGWYVLGDSGAGEKRCGEEHALRGCWLEGCAMGTLCSLAVMSSYF